MSQDDLAERLDAVERRLDAAYPEPTAGAVDSDTVERVEAFAERLADLEAAVEAVEGYVGEIERVDEELERRADAALAAADDLEARVDSIESELDAVPSQRAPDLDDRLAEQTVALEELRVEVGSLDDRVVALEPGGGSGENAVSDRGVRGRTTECTCAGSTPKRLDDDATPFGAHRSAADGGFERPDRTPTEAPDATEARETDGRVATGAPGPGSEPTAPGDAPDTRSSLDGNDRPGRPNRETASYRPADHARTAGAQSDAGGTSVSGWGDEPIDSPARTAPRRDDAPGDPAPRTTATDDRSWTDANSETLLDRLRSLL